MKKNSPAYVIVFITIISLVFGAAISAVHYLSLPTLEKNERMLRNRSISRAFNLNVEPPTADAFESAVSKEISKKELKGPSGTMQLYIKNSEPRDIGFVFRGMGFWDEISGILVLSPDLDTIKSVEILDQKETPGLGARIAESWFKEQFNSILLDWKKPADKRLLFGSETANGKTINGITGATQTTTAFQRILNSELELFIQLYRSENQ